MRSVPVGSISQVSWNGRVGWQLSNAAIEATVLECGGHVASIRSLQGGGSSNLLWEAPWKTVGPREYDAGVQDRSYGPAVSGKFLACFTGHALCFDYFGLPSDEEAAHGLTLHGEAAVARWTAEPISPGLRLHAHLTYAGLSVERELLLRDHAPVLYIAEMVSNLRRADRAIHWVQHVTLGSPFLAVGESVIAIPATRAKTWPLGYGGKSGVPDDTEFSWPRLGELDLSRPFARAGCGMVLALLIDGNREYGFIAALNWRLGIVFGYCFRRHDFPWVAVWEENQARRDPPWNGRTQACGLEFGTTPMPLGKARVFDAGPLFDTPTWLTLPGGGQKCARYAAFAVGVPHDWHELHDIEICRNSLSLHGRGKQKLEFEAPGVREWLQ